MSDGEQKIIISHFDSIAIPHERNIGTSIMQRRMKKIESSTDLSYANSGDIIPTD